MESLEAEHDRAGWFPNKVTEFVHKDVEDPLMDALHVLSAEQKRNVMRKLERAIQEETITMTAEERDTFERDWTNECEKIFYRLEICLQDFRDRRRTTDWIIQKDKIFETQEAATNALKQWIDENGVQDYRYPVDSWPFDHGDCQTIINEAMYRTSISEHYETCVSSSGQYMRVDVTKMTQAEFRVHQKLQIFESSEEIQEE